MIGIEDPNHILGNLNYRVECACRIWIFDPDPDPARAHMWGHRDFDGLKPIKFTMASRKPIWVDFCQVGFDHFLSQI